MQRRAAMLVVGIGVLIPQTVWASVPPAAESSASLTGEFAEDRVIVGFDSGVTAVERAQTLSTDVVEDHDVVSAAGDPVTEVVELQSGVSVEEAIAEYADDPNVAFVEPDYVVTSGFVSDDPGVANGYLWGMGGDEGSPYSPYGSAAAEAWADGFTGSKNIAVGIIDEGLDFTHPELAANIWTNPFDPVDGVDNDHNGYVDDVHGWDFYNNDNSVFDGAANPDIDAHGTHVAGTIGGVGGNGQGVAGVNWNVTIISTKFLGYDGGYTSDAIAAINYLVDMKVRHGVNVVAINNSWGGDSYSQALENAINNAGDHGMVFVASAGNDTQDNDSTPQYPANYDCSRGGTRGWDCIVSVASIANNGLLSYFSDFGASTVDLGAPGSSILSTVPPASYAYYSGTSMAAPHVTGAIALCASIDPSQTAAELRAAVIDSVAATPSLSGKTATGGRLDIGAMVLRCMPSLDPVSGEVSNLTTPSSTAKTMSLAWTQALANATRIDVESAVFTDGACGTFNPAGTTSGNATSLRVKALSPGTNYCFRVRGANPVSGGTYSEWSNVAVGSTAPALAFVTPSVLPPANVNKVYWYQLAVAGGTPPYTIQMISPPAGVSVLADGRVLKGNPPTDVYRTFFFTVQVTDADGSTATQAFSILVLPKLPSEFNKGAPANRSTNRARTRLTLTWKKSSGATSYQYCVDTINDNQCNTTWVSTRSLRATVRGLAPKTTYYWQVRAVNAGGYTEANHANWFRFTTRR